VVGFFKEGKMALLSHNGCFMSIDQNEDAVIAKSRKAGPSEIVNLRCQMERKDSKDDGPSDEKGSLKDVELNFV
jgi:protein FRG1